MFPTSIRRTFILLLLLTLGCTVQRQNRSNDDVNLSPSEAFPTKVKLADVTGHQASDQAQGPPELSGFFKPGNFGVLTVPTQDGRRAPLTIKSTDVKVQVEGRLAKTVVTQESMRTQLLSFREKPVDVILPVPVTVKRLSMMKNLSCMMWF